MTVTIGRRELLAAVGGAAACPLAARAQQPTMPVIGFLSSGSQQSDVWRLVEFRRGLSETGYVEGRNVMSHFSWADEQYERFTHLAREGRMTVTIGRRELIAALGGAAVAWPLVARAQQPAMPVIGFLSAASSDAYRRPLGRISPRFERNRLQFGSDRSEADRLRGC